MLVAVDPDPPGEVDHRLQGDVAVAEELGQGLDQHRAHALDPGQPGLVGQRCGVDVDEHGDAEFVSQLAGQGARVAFVDIDTDRGRALEQALLADSTDALFLECDVRDVPALQAAIAGSGEQLGPIRVLVNNAANDHRDRVLEMDQALRDDRIAVNVRHHFFAAQAVVGMMRESGGGSMSQPRIDQCAH